MNESLKLTLGEANLEDIFTIVYFHVDEFYQQIAHLVTRTGPTPAFSDSEVITLTLVNQLVNDSETAFYKFVKSNYKPLFPNSLTAPATTGAAKVSLS